jgi:glycerophosphoryl diester phosphodiesterase
MTAASATYSHLQSSWQVFFPLSSFLVYPGSRLSLELSKMHPVLFELAAALTAAGIVGAAPLDRKWEDWNKPENYYISYGPRPYFILQNMTEGPLKTKLESCQNGPFEVTGWSIGHRGGGTLLIPEETVASTLAGARMGAGILECDVAFTSDLELVCRHDQCDLHRTTDLLAYPERADRCTVPFSPANETADASATCCTSDFTLEEFLGLCSKMDGFNTSVSRRAGENRTPLNF